MDQYLVMDNWIENDPAMRVAIGTALPFQRVCQKDCEGFCSGCGVNLNSESEHHHEVLNPCWVSP